MTKANKEQIKTIPSEVVDDILEMVLNIEIQSNQPGAQKNPAIWINNIDTAMRRYFWNYHKDGKFID